MEEDSTGNPENKNNNTYINKTIENIKKEVSRYINLDKKKSNETDKKMEVVLLDLLEGKHQKEVLNNFLFIDYDFGQNKVKEILILYYTAIYFDNVSLLNKLISAETNFTNEYNKLSLYLLDNDITSKFEEDEYVEIIKNWQQQFHGLYYSVKDLLPEVREKYLERFSYLIKELNKKHSKSEEKETYLCDISLKELVSKPWLFTKKSLDSFTDKTYLMADLKQLNLMGDSNLIFRIEKSKKPDKILKRVNELIQKTDFCQIYIDFDLIFSLFSNQELENIGYSESAFFKKCSEDKKLLDKALDLYTQVPELVHKYGWCIEHTTFREIENDILIEMYNHNIDLSLKSQYLKPASNLYKPKVLVRKLINKNKKNKIQTQNN